MYMNRIALSNPASELYPKDVLDDFGNEWSGFIENDGDSTDDIYFNSYGYIGIHEEMLKDSVRTGIYHKAIVGNSHVFKDKVVMDVGCGTGILSLFCAKAGAKHVYAIDNSSVIKLAEKIVAVNGMSDSITFIQGKVEEITEPIEKVDIIVCEWMGYCLLYENMLSSVLFCRDKWLKPNGLLFPDRARLFIAGIEDGKFKTEKFDCWSDTFGLNFSLMKGYLMEEAIVDVVEHNSMITNSYCILDLDLYKCTVEDSDFTTNFKLTCQRTDYVHAFVFWFDVIFTACERSLTLTTSPRSKYTHWKHTILYTYDDINVNINDNICGIIAIRKNPDNNRDVDIKISYQVNCTFNNNQYVINAATNHNKLKCQFYRIR